MIAIPLAFALIVIVTPILLAISAPDRAHRQPARSARAQARLPMAREPEAGPASKRSPGPAGTAPAGNPVPARAVPLAPRGRHHAGQPRQPWNTAEMPAVREPLATGAAPAEEFTCEPHQAVPGFYRHHLAQRDRRLW